MRVEVLQVMVYPRGKLKKACFAQEDAPWMKPDMEAWFLLKYNRLDATLGHLVQK